MNKTKGVIIEQHTKIFYFKIYIAKLGMSQVECEVFSSVELFW